MTYLEKAGQVQVVSDGPVQRYLAEGWKLMTKEEYEKWADARWKKTKEVMHRNLTQQAAKAKAEDKPGLFKKLMDQAERYAPKKAPSKTEKAPA